MPVEYQALGQPLGPEDFVPADVVASGIVLIGVLGVGGGGELDNAITLQKARARLGRRAGTAVYEDFRSREDPEAPVTVLRKRFPHQKPPKRVAKGSLALPDPGLGAGSCRRSCATAAPRPGVRPGGLRPSSELADLVERIVKRQGGMSNALLVSAGESESGRPLAVFGPQTGYFGPQPMIEMDIHGPSFDSRGAVVVGTPWVALGRGRDYAWSATSQSNDVQDVYARRPLRAGWLQAHDRLDALPLPRPVPADRGDREAGVLAVQPGRLDSVRQRHAARPAHEDRDRDRAGHHQGQARALHAPALQLRARDRRDGGGGALVERRGPGPQRTASS